ncbi:MAG: sugar ABC transporter permease [Clostridia bacterium]|nr:sugar ABC transporter permease [Clostridia bacterium]
MQITTKTKKKILDRVFIWGMLLLPIIWFLTFWLYVNLNSILMGFKVYVGAGKYEWSLQNFKDIFYEFSLPDSVLPLALKNTLKFFPLNLLTIALSVLFSYLFYRRMPGYKVFRVIFYLPSIISGVIMVTVFKNVIGPNGPLALMLKNYFGYTAETIPYFTSDPKYAMGTILFFTVWTSFGLNVIMFGGAMARAPQQVIESARVDGVGMFRELFSIMVPLIWPTLSTVLIFALAGIFTASGVTLLMTNGAYDTMTISLYIFQNVTAASYEMPSALGLLFTIIGFPIVLVGRHFLNKIFAEVEY